MVHQVKFMWQGTPKIRKGASLMSAVAVEEQWDDLGTYNVPHVPLKGDELYIRDSRGTYQGTVSAVSHTITDGEMVTIVYFVW